MVECVDSPEDRTGSVEVLDDIVPVQVRRRNDGRGSEEIGPIQSIVGVINGQAGHIVNGGEGSDGFELCGVHSVGGQIGAEDFGAHDFVRRPENVLLG